MGNVTKADIVAAVNTRFRDKANAGIVWGTNSFPSYGLASWFRGTTAGVPDKFAASDIPSVNPKAAEVVAALQTFVNKFAYVRKARITIYYSTDYGSYLETDKTAIGYMADSAGNIASVVPLPEISKDAVLSLTKFNAAVDRLYENYLAQCRNVALNKSSTHCHSSCHSSCHSNVPVCHSSCHSSCHSNVPACHSSCHSNVVCHTSCHSSCHDSCHSNVVCHASCHDSCHSARGRR